MQNNTVITNGNVDDNDIERVGSFQSLQAGQYWRSIQDIPEQAIETNTILLIESIRYIDDKAHTIILRPHPLKIGRYEKIISDGEEKYFYFEEHRFLIDNFLNLFVFEHDALIIRNREIQKVQKEIEFLQRELVEAQSTPDILNRIIEERLSEEDKSIFKNSITPPQSTNLSATIEKGITEQSIQVLKTTLDVQHQIALIKSECIQNKVSAIAKTIEKLTPFYEEQAAAVLAKTQDVINHVKNLKKGIESLDLYIGKDVSVRIIKEGTPAEKEIPLTFVQKKLIMDEELAVFLDLNEWFDFGDQHLFFDAINKYDALIEQIFPTKRCILVMATTYRYVDYKDPLLNRIHNQQNHNVFLLVRNGMNIYQVYSPVESHLGTSRLFPSNNEQKNIFKGFNGENIKFDDIAYTDKVEEHNDFALHYKRFLILICGLDHRLKLFGDFYDEEQSLKFISLNFQEKYCHFLHDDDGTGLLPKEKKMPVTEWVKNKNAYMQSGSRMLCNWSAVMNADTAPSACRCISPTSYGFEQRYTPKDKFGVAIAYRDKQDICVDVLVSGYSYSLDENRKFNCKVNLTKLTQDDYCNLPFLCLDSINIDELHWYIHNRDSRRKYIYYIQMFKMALKHIEKEQAIEKLSREYLKTALLNAKITTPDNVDDLINDGIIAWRAKNRGASLPSTTNKSSSEWNSLLNQMYFLAGKGKNNIPEIENYIKSMGYELLRITLSGTAQVIAYTEPKPDECDNRLEDHCWVNRLVINKGKKNYSIKSKSWVLLNDNNASETILIDYEPSKKWLNLKPSISSYNQKQKIFNFINEALTKISNFTLLDKQESIKIFDEWKKLRNNMCNKSRYVKNPYLLIPFGLYLQNGQIKFICLYNQSPHSILSNFTSDEIKISFTEEFMSLYRNKDAARNELSKVSDWALVYIDIDKYKHYSQGIFSKELDCLVRLDGKHKHDPRLSAWFKNWINNEDNLRFYLPENIKDKKGSLILDTILGIQTPVEFTPIRFRKTFSHTWECQFREWIDIFNCDTCDFKYQKNHYNDKDYTSIEEAYTALDEIKTKENIKSSKELPDSPQPPDGVERWYFV